MNKDQYGGNNATSFIDDYILQHKLNISPQLRLLLINKLEIEEKKLIQPILNEIKSKNLKDEDDATYFKKLEQRKREFESQDQNRPKYKVGTKEDIEIMVKHENEIKGINVPQESVGDASAEFPPLPSRDKML